MAMAQRNAHNGITRVLQPELWFGDQLELAVGYVGIGEHNYKKTSLNTILEQFRKSETLEVIIGAIIKFMTPCYIF